MDIRELEKFVGRPKDEFERATYTLKHEVGASFYDSNGVCIAVAAGDENKVVMPPIPRGIVYGITHNHIDDSLFSEQDIEKFCTTDVIEMRATTPSGKYCSIRKRDGFNPRLYEVFICERALERERVFERMAILVDVASVDMHDLERMRKEAFRNFVRKSLSYFSEKYRFIFTEGDLV